MAFAPIFRGGTPIFKPMFCAGEGAEYTTPFDAQHQPGTPPYDSHADAAHEQGYLNLHYPLVPNLADTRAHAWMQNLLAKYVKNSGDILLTNWVPMRSYLDSYYIELVTPDADMTGVYVTPVAYRAKPDPNDYENPDAVTWEEITDFSDDINTVNGARKVPLGTPGDGDKRYLMARFSNKTGDAPLIPWSFGHNLVKKNGTTFEAEDDYYGAVVLGLKVEGDASKIALLANGNFELYLTAKCLTFEGSAQIG